METSPYCQGHEQRLQRTEQLVANLTARQEKEDYRFDIITEKLGELAGAVKAVEAGMAAQHETLRGVLETQKHDAIRRKKRNKYLWTGIGAAIATLGSQFGGLIWSWFSGPAK